MLRMSRLTDYATVVLTRMAQSDAPMQTAADLAAATHLAPPTVSKVLKALTRAGLVTSFRGAHGGYSLSRPPRQITAEDIIDALEGPVAITECASVDSHCEIESYCGVGSAWQRINLAIRRALGDITLEQLASWKPSSTPSMDFTGTQPCKDEARLHSPGGKS